MAAIARLFAGRLLRNQGGARRILAASVASCCSVTNIGFAADLDQQRGLEEVIVTAQKREERLQDVPISISVMSGEKFEHSSIEGIADALRRIPGVDAGPSIVGGATQLNVRGVGTDFGVFSGSSPVAYYVDSVPFGLVKSAVVPDSSAYDLERVEVLRGPQGTLYGATALNGAVRVLTHDADLDRFEFKARTGFSGTEEGEPSYGGDVAVNIPIIEDKLAVRLIAGHQFLGGWIDSPADNNVNSTTSDNLRLKINAQPTEQLSVGVSYWRSRIESDAPSTGDLDDTTPLTGAQPLHTYFDSFGLKVGYDFSGFTLSSVSSFLTFDNSGVLDFGGIALFTGLESEVFAQEINLVSTGDGPWRWSLGAFYRDAEDTLIQDYSIPGIFSIDYGDTSESAAVFGEVGRMLTSELELTVGLRYFHDEVSNFQRKLDVGQAPGTPLQDIEETFTATTPRIVLTWEPSDTFTAYASYSEGFRSGFPQNVNVLLVAPTFPVVQPDTLRNYEIGAKGDSFGGLLTFDAALYYIDWEGVQQQRTVLFNNIGVTAPVNAGSASGLGIDLAVSVRPTEGLEIGGTLSWNDLTIDQDVLVADSNGPGGQAVLFAAGDRLQRSPEFTGGAFVDYSFPMGGGFEGVASFSANYTDSQPVNSLVNGIRIVQLGDTLLVSRGSFTISPESDRWSAMLFVDNLSGEDGSPPDGLTAGLGSGDVRRARLRPRTVGIQLRYNF